MIRLTSTESMALFNGGEGSCCAEIRLVKDSKNAEKQTLKMIFKCFTMQKYSIF